MNDDVVDSAASPQTSADVSPGFAATQSVLAPPGYDFLCEVGHGGMGVVYRARHVALDRPVALKYLLGSFAYPDVIARFLYEAKVTARLQHPGIPPVHEVGTLADGRPFMAMKLIEGRNLAELLRERGPGAARWLATFEAICQAVAYAHSQGIIHRDLKPGNVMVGAFGEVQVMDWGLAKTLAEPRAALVETPVGPLSEDDAPATVAPRQDADSGQTQHGSVLGTPAYMPPEQAVGALDKLDRRSDVFGLGAILCDLLTGKPPFVAKDAESTRQLAARTEVTAAFSLLDKCGAEPELVALAKRCLSAEPDGRPADAGVLAEEVATLRRAADDRARQAELDKARAEVQAESQRRRRRLLLVGGSVLVVVLLAGLGGTTAAMIAAWKARGVADKERGEAVDARREAEEDRGKAEKARDLARRRYQLALDAFNDMVFGIQEKLENRPGTQELRKDLLTNARKGLRRLLEEAERQGSPDRTLVVAHGRMGDVERMLGNTAAALAEYQAGHDLAQRLADADDNADGQLELSISLQKLGDVMLQLGKTNEALGRYERSLGIFQRSADADPKNAQAQRALSVSLNKLGDVLLRLNRTKDALEQYSKSLEISQRLADADPRDAQAQRDLSVSHYKLGYVMLQLGKPKEALAHYSKSVRISQQLADADPKNAQTQRGLSVSLDRLGDLLLLLNKPTDALEQFSKCQEITRRLADADPRNALVQRDLGVNANKLGDVMLRLGKPKEALAHFEKFRQVAQRLADADPQNAEAQRDLSASLNKLGDVMLRLGKPKEALSHFEKFQQVTQRLADADPRNANAQRDLGISHERMGDVLLRLGQSKEALAQYERFQEILQRLADADPKIAQAQMDLFVSNWKLGNAEKAQHDYVKASAWFAKGRAVVLPWHEKKLLVGQFKDVVALVDRELAFCKNADRSVARLSFAFAQPPEQVGIWSSIRVRALLHRGHVGEAIRTAECWAEWTERLVRNRDTACYDAACALALCATDAKSKDALVRKAVAALERARAAGFFDDARRVAHFERDADFAAVRTHPAVVAFAASLMKN